MSLATVLTAIGIVGFIALAGWIAWRAADLDRDDKDFWP